jgi:outer membrane protein assembly factor BamB
VARESGQVYWLTDLNEGQVGKKTGGFFGIGARARLRPVWSSPLLASNRLILGSSTGQLVAMNAKSGAVEKRLDIGGPVLIGPIAAGDTIYLVTDEAQLVALR